jgi:hypothetical protein
MKLRALKDTYELCSTTPTPVYFYFSNLLQSQLLQLTMRYPFFLVSRLFAKGSFLATGPPAAPVLYSRGSENGFKEGKFERLNFR